MITRGRTFIIILIARAFPRRDRRPSFAHRAISGSKEASCVFDASPIGLARARARALFTLDSRRNRQHPRSRAPQGRPRRIENAESSLFRCDYRATGARSARTRLAETRVRALLTKRTTSRFSRAGILLCANSAQSEAHISFSCPAMRDAFHEEGIGKCLSGQRGTGLLICLTPSRRGVACFPTRIQHAPSAARRGKRSTASAYARLEPLR